MVEGEPEDTKDAQSCKVFVNNVRIMECDLEIFLECSCMYIQGASSLRSLAPCTCVEVFEWYG